MSEENLIDATDRRILAALQTQGRLSFEALADQVGLSASAVLRRVKRLEDSGVITGYAALLAPQQLGLGLAAYITVRLEKHSDRRNPMEAFAASVQAWPEVAECAALSGEMDYLLRVLVRDMAHYSSFVMDRLLKHPSVVDCKTSFVLRHLKATTAVPL